MGPIGGVPGRSLWVLAGWGEVSPGALQGCSFRGLSTGILADAYESVLIGVGPARWGPPSGTPGVQLWGPGALYGLCWWWRSQASGTLGVLPWGLSQGSWRTRCSVLVGEGCASGTTGLQPCEPIAGGPGGPLWVFDGGGGVRPAVLHGCRLRAYWRGSWWTPKVCPGGGGVSPAALQGCIQEGLSEWVLANPCRSVLLGERSGQRHSRAAALGASWRGS